MRILTIILFLICSLGLKAQYVHELYPCKDDAGTIIEGCFALSLSNGRYIESYLDTSYCQGDHRFNIYVAANSHWGVNQGDLVYNQILEGACAKEDTYSELNLYESNDTTYWEHIGSDSTINLVWESCVSVFDTVGTIVKHWTECSNSNNDTWVEGDTIVLSAVVDLDTDPTNELQDLSGIRDSIQNNLDNTIVLRDDLDDHIANDLDTDPTNELITSTVVRNDSVFVIENGVEHYTGSELSGGTQGDFTLTQELRDGNNDLFGFELKHENSDGSTQTEKLDSLRYCIVIYDYDDLDNYNGVQECLIIRNDEYAGTWVRDESKVVTSNNYGVVRQAANGYIYARVYSGNANAAWWDFINDGTTDEAARLQDLSDFTDDENLRALEFSDFMDIASSYVSWYPNNGVSDREHLEKIIGNGATIRSVNAPTDKVMWYFGASAGIYRVSESLTITGFNFVGQLPNNGRDAVTDEWAADSLSLLQFQKLPFIEVNNCQFKNITGQAVYFKEVPYTNAGNAGVNVHSNKFENIAIDTLGNTSMILFEGVEYSSVSNNDCLNCPLFFRGIGNNANNNILNNRITGYNSTPLDVRKYYSDRGTIYHQADGGNFGKYTIMGNKLNHLKLGGIVPIVINHEFEGTVEFNESNGCKVIGNDLIANGDLNLSFIQLWVLTCNVIVTNNIFSGNSIINDNDGLVRYSGDGTMTANNNHFSRAGRLFDLREVDSKLIYGTNNIVKGGPTFNSYLVLSPASLGQIMYTGTDVPEYADDAAATSDTQLSSGSYYRVTASSNLRIK